MDLLPLLQLSITWLRRCYCHGSDKTNEPLLLL